LRFQIRKRPGQRIDVAPEFTEVGDRIIASASWLDDEGTRLERYQVLTVRDGKIVDIQGCASRSRAERFARRRSRTVAA